MNPSDFNPDLVDISLQKNSSNHTVSNFELLNQNGDTITQEDYKNKIYVADFFFTRCPSICPVMTNNMVELQKKWALEPSIQFLSHTVDPETDIPSKLKRYAKCMR